MLLSAAQARVPPRLKAVEARVLLLLPPVVVEAQELLLLPPTVMEARALPLPRLMAVEARALLLPPVAAEAQELPLLPVAVEAQGLLLVVVDLDLARIAMASLARRPAWLRQESMRQASWLALVSMLLVKELEAFKAKSARFMTVMVVKE